MGGFTASLMLEGDTQPLAATLKLSDGRLSIDAADQTIGEWGLKDVHFERTPSGFRARVEGEEIILDMDEAAAFEEAIAESTGKRRKGRKQNAEKARTPKARTEKPKKRDKKPEKRAEKLEKPESATESTDGGFKEKALAALDRVIESSEKRWGALLPDWVFSRRTAGVLGLTLVAMLVFPGIAATALLFGGLAVVIFGAVLYTDDVLAVRVLPGRATAMHVLIAGVGVVVFGFLLAIAFG